MGARSPVGAGTRSRVTACTLVLLCFLAGCREAPPPPSDPELRASLGLDDATRIHQVLLSGRGDRTRVIPAHLTVAEGDVVQFRVMDGRVHRLRFDADSISPEGLQFLVATRQTSLPPLVERDARLVLTFQGAPPGDYPFVVEGAGEPVRGRLRIPEP